MSTVLSTSDSWHGFDSLRFLVIFGDSFSSVGYSAGSPQPSADEPLGTTFPGETSCERLNEDTQQFEYDPNWVGHLAREVNAERQGSGAPLLVYDYAISGDTVARMKTKQIGKEFLPHFGSHPDWAPWTASDTLFMTWIGINDCTWNQLLGVTSAQAALDDLFAAQEQLYQAGARNFCFIDVPPAHKFPKGPARAQPAFEGWNDLLRAGVDKFKAAHSDATIFMFSSWDLFTRTLPDTSLRGLEGKAAVRARNALFVDGFHPSTALHAVIAKEILAFLKNQPASATPSAS